MRELPDIFCELYDGIDHDEFRDRAPDWLRDAGIRSSATNFLTQLASGSLNAARLRVRLDNNDDREKTRFTLLTALDRLFVSLNPLISTGEAAPPSLAWLAVEVAATHRLDSGRHGGALIARLAATEDEFHAPTHPRDAFASVLRVDASDWDACDLRVLPDDAGLLRHDLLGGLRIGCIPFIADATEMRFNAFDRDGRRLYRIGPRDTDTTLARVDTVLDGLIASDVRVGVVPELALSDALLDKWVEALADRRGATGSLHWLLVGSGNLGGEPHTNEAVLLNAQNGVEITRQRKLTRFNIDGPTLQRWKLDALLGAQPVAEDITPSGVLTILDAGVIRVAILICEDLANVIDLGPRLRGLGVTHIFVPVFSRPIKTRRWEQTHADLYRRATGAVVVIANSRVMHEVCGDANDGTGLVLSPEATSLLHSTTAEDIATFTLSSDGDVVVD